MEATRGNGYAPVRGSPAMMMTIGFAWQRKSSQKSAHHTHNADVFNLTANIDSKSSSVNANRMSDFVY